MESQAPERLVDVDAGALGEHAFGLFDEHPAVQRMVELLVHVAGVHGCVVLQDGDGGHVSERTGGGQFVIVHGAAGRAEQVEGSNGGTAQAHWHG